MDHLHVPMSYRVKEGVKLHSHSNVCEGSLFVKLDEAATSPDLQVHIGSIFFNPNGFIPEGEGFTLTPTLIHPRSRGTIRLRSNGPLEKPQIVANYLTDKEQYDMAVLKHGLNLVRQLGFEMVRCPLFWVRWEVMLGVGTETRWGRGAPGTFNPE